MSKVKFGAKNSIYYPLIPASVFLMSQIHNCLGFPSDFFDLCCVILCWNSCFFQENGFYRPHQPNQHLPPARGVRTCVLVEEVCLRRDEFSNRVCSLQSVSVCTKSFLAGKKNLCGASTRMRVQVMRRVSAGGVWQASAPL